MQTEWSRYRLVNHCHKIGSGATPRGGKDAYKGGSTALIRSQNVHNERFHHDGLAYINDAQAAELKNVEVQPNDVLLNITGDSVARCCMVDNDILPARVNQHVAIIRPKPGKLDAKFLRYTLVSSSYQSHLLALASAGATRNALTKSMIEGLEIEAPALPEQKRIAHILGTLDDKIELNRKMNATLEAMARALFKSWFVDFDPVRAKMEGRQPEGMDAETAALFPDELVESELGLIPKGWEVKPLSEMIEILSGGTPKTTEPAYWDGDIPWFSVKDVPADGDVWVIDTEKKITQAGVDNSAAKVLPVGTTIISARGTVGKLALTGAAMAMNQSCYGIRGADGYGHYFTHFNLKQVVAELQQHTHGTVFDTVTRQTFEMLKCIAPKIEVPTIFDVKVRPLLEEIRCNLQVTRILVSLRDSLINNLIRQPHL